MSLEEIYHFTAHNARLASAGLPQPEEIAFVKSAGYETIINLLPGYYEGVSEEETRIRALEIDYVHIPVEWNAPQLSDLERFFAAMQEREDKRIFVHCAANMRATAFLFLYRTLIAGEDAKAPAATMARIWEPNPTWQDFIAEAQARWKNPSISP